MPKVTRSDLLTIPNAVSVVRTIIAWIAILFLWQSIEQGRVDQAPLWVVVFIGAMVMDALDGWLARKLNSYSSIGSYIDILGDRLCECPAWLLLSYANPSTRVLVVIIVARNVVVDGVKLVTTLKGIDMAKGVPRMSAFGEFVVNHPYCKTLHNTLKTTAILAGLVGVLYHGSRMRAFGLIALALHAGFCVTRGLGSVLELRSILKAQPGSVDKGGVARYTVQWTVSLAALVAVLAIH